MTGDCDHQELRRTMDARIAWCKTCGAIRLDLDAAWTLPTREASGDERVRQLAEDLASAQMTIASLQAKTGEPVPMRLVCERCGELHIDEGEFATKSHHTHTCQHCGLNWRPAKVATVGVQWLPGYKNKAGAS